MQYHKLFTALAVVLHFFNASAAPTDASANDQLDTAVPAGGTDYRISGENVTNPNITVGGTFSPSSANEEISLFDGKTLNGWAGNKVFSVIDGVIIGDSTVKDAGSVVFLETDKDYADFTLRLKVKMEKIQKGFLNSGIMIRSDYEVDIGQGSWGGLYSSKTKKFLSTLPAVEVAKIVKQDDWNDMEITCHGSRFVIRVNGIKTADWIEPMLKTQRVAHRGM